MTSKIILDKLGICTSALCAVHCLITPLFIILLPFSSFAFFESEGFELGVLALSLFLATLSLAHAYFRIHSNLRPIMIAAIGFVFLLTGKTFNSELIEVSFSLIGGSLVVLAHYKNLRATRRTYRRP